MKTSGTIQSIHDIFDGLDELVSIWMLTFALTPDERQQLHQMLAEHHDHLADTINDGGTYDIPQGGSGVPPLNDQPYTDSPESVIAQAGVSGPADAHTGYPSDQSNPSDDTVAVIDVTTPILTLSVRVSPCLSVQVCDCPCGCKSEAHIG